tara:strand:- start:195 stop:1100 length:906 start_codon:yes stop_codon:yes gene_type:complete
MASFIENMSPKEWEAFCEIMLRHHYGAKNFWVVPDQDGGDLGLEFYTIDGTIFQCYYPEKGVEMKIYKQKIQKKIREDLKKLKDNEKEIAKLMDDIVVNQWVLLTPENKSKELITYCNKKKKETVSENISYIDNNDFVVKIETADTFRDGMLFAQSVYSSAIDIPLMEVTDEDKTKWLSGNSEFSNNIDRKSNSLMGEKSKTFKGKVIARYIQIDKFLEQLRDEHPDLYELIEDSARAQLENMQEASLFEDKIDSEFVKGVVDNNKQAFKKHSKFMSDKNMQSLSFGYLSKWIAECYMDFE